MVLKVLTGGLAVLLALTLQIKAQSVLGWSPELVLATLIALACFSGAVPLLVAAIVSSWVLNWQPHLSWELFVFTALPLIFLFSKRHFPLQMWLVNALGVAASVAAFYSLVDYSLFFTHTKIVWSDIVVSTAYGSLLFQVFHAAYGRLDAERLS